MVGVEVKDGKETERTLVLAHLQMKLCWQERGLSLAGHYAGAGLAVAADKSSSTALSWSQISCNHPRCYHQGSTNSSKAGFICVHGASETLTETLYSDVASSFSKSHLRWCRALQGRSFRVRPSEMDAFSS